MFASFFGDLGSLCSMVIVGMFLAIILANKVAPQAKEQAASKGIEAILRRLFGGK